MNRDLDLRQDLCEQADRHTPALPCRRPGTARLALAAAIAVAAVNEGPVPAQAAVVAGPTTTTLASNATVPRGGVVLKGANGTTHYWTADNLLGLCRIDPNATSPTGFSINHTTCVLFINGKQIKAAQASYDPVRNFIYVPDMSSASQGVVRLHYDPKLGGGNGGISVLGRTTFGGSCFGKNLPWGSAFGPDGNLYVSFKASPNIDRIVNPHLRPTCANVDVVGNASDNRSAFALAFVGTDLWEGDNKGIGVIGNAIDPACTLGACPSSEIFTGLTPLPTALTADDLNGVLYIGGATDVYAFDTINGDAPVVYQPGFTFVFGLAVDPSTVALGVAPTLYGGEDPSQGVQPEVGSVFRIK
jgi:hypothetical protein